MTTSMLEPAVRNQAARMVDVQWDDRTVGLALRANLLAPGAHEGSQLKSPRLSSEAAQRYSQRLRGQGIAMRTVTKWSVIATVPGLAASPVIATEFKEIQVWIGGGITGHYSGFSALADGTLATVKKSTAAERAHEVCASATPEESATLARLIDQIPATAPWGKQLWFPDNCADELEVSLIVLAGRGDLDVHYSLQCTPTPPPPRWVTALVDAMRTLQQKHQACSAGAEPSR